MDSPFNRNYSLYDQSRGYNPASSMSPSAGVASQSKGIGSNKLDAEEGNSGNAGVWPMSRSASASNLAASSDKDAQGQFSQQQDPLSGFKAFQTQQQQQQQQAYEAYANSYTAQYPQYSAASQYARMNAPQQYAQYADYGGAQMYMPYMSYGGYQLPQSQGYGALSGMASGYGTAFGSATTAGRSASVSTIENEALRLGKSSSISANLAESGLPDIASSNSAWSASNVVGGLSADTTPDVVESGDLTSKTKKKQEEDKDSDAPQWYYIDMSGVEQGPYGGTMMNAWSRFFREDTMLRRPSDTAYLSYGNLIRLTQNAAPFELKIAPKQWEEYINTAKQWEEFSQKTAENGQSDTVVQQQQQQQQQQSQPEPQQPQQQQSQPEPQQPQQQQQGNDKNHEKQQQKQQKQESKKQHKQHKETQHDDSANKGPSSAKSGSEKSQKSKSAAPVETVSKQDVGVSDKVAESYDEVLQSPRAKNAETKEVQGSPKNAKQQQQQQKPQKQPAPKQSSVEPFPKAPTTQPAKVVKTEPAKAPTVDPWKKPAQTTPQVSISELKQQEIQKQQLKKKVSAPAPAASSSSRRGSQQRNWLPLEEMQKLDISGQSEAPETPTSAWSKKTTPPARSLADIQREQASRAEKTKVHPSVHTTTAPSTASVYASKSNQFQSLDPSVKASGNASAARTAAAVTPSAAAKKQQQVPRPYTSITQVANSAKPTDELIHWCLVQFKDLHKGIDRMELLEVFLSLPNNDKLREFIAESIYDYSSILDGRKFAGDFVSRKKDAEKSMPSGTTWKDVLTRFNPNMQEQDPSFKVVTKKRGPKIVRPQ